jgi:uncharacterized membrane protein
VISRTSSTCSPSTHPSMLVDSVNTNRNVEDQLSKAHVIAAVARRSLPSVVEATVVPAAIFYLGLVNFGPTVGMVGALSWSYGAIARRVVFQRRVPALLGLATLGLTARTAIGVTSGTFIYLLQPIVTTLVLAAVFFASLCVGRPIIGRLAHDFCPLSPEIASRPSIKRLFSRLTLLWASVHLVSAVATFVLLLSLSTPTFVLVKTTLSLAVTSGAIALTIAAAIRTASAENLVLAQPVLVPSVRG